MAITRNHPTRSLADACFVRRFAENPNYLVALSTRYNFGNSEILLCPQVHYELEKYGLSISELSTEITKILGAKVVLAQSTIPEYILAENLVEQFAPALHWPDNLILAAAIQNKATLLTCDKVLAEVALRCGHKCINPDLIGTWGAVA